MEHRIGKHVIHVGDMKTTLAGLDPDSLDACVTDPPYELGFMGKSWDRSGVAFDPETWAAVYRVLKPGAYLLAFGGTRTVHRIACAIEDAGFEVRDQIAWMFGSGFPKSLDVSKAIDKAERGVPQGGADPTSPNHSKYKGGGSTDNPTDRGFGAGPGAYMAEAGTTDTRELSNSARQWDGWGTALKPAYEPIIVARKPLIGTVAQNVTAYGTGAINVDGCRIPTDDKLGGGDQLAKTKIASDGWDRPWMQDDAAKAAHAERVNANVAKAEALGRWPANVCLDESAAAALDAMSGVSKSTGGNSRQIDVGSGRYNWNNGKRHVEPDGRDPGYGDTGGASRFMYVAKASRRERGPGNTHPTVKPVELMRWLCRLVTPPGGTVLDPFAGSGSTGIAADQEGFVFMGIELDDDYAAIAARRLEANAPLFLGIN